MGDVFLFIFSHLLYFSFLTRVKSYSELAEKKNGKGLVKVQEMNENVKFTIGKLGIRKWRQSLDTYVSLLSP